MLHRIFNFRRGRMLSVEIRNALNLKCIKHGLNLTKSPLLWMYEIEVTILWHPVVDQTNSFNKVTTFVVL